MAKFVILVTFGDLAARDAARPSHRAYLTLLFEQGKIHESGPFLDEKGALIIYEAADEEEARALLAADPYTLAPGVIDTAEVRGWNRVLPSD